MVVHCRWHWSKGIWHSGRRNIIAGSKHSWAATLCRWTNGIPTTTFQILWLLSCCLCFIWFTVSGLILVRPSNMSWKKWMWLPVCNIIIFLRNEKHWTGTNILCTKIGVFRKTDYVTHFSKRLVSLTNWQKLQQLSWMLLSTPFKITCLSSTAREKTR